MRVKPARRITNRAAARNVCTDWLIPVAPPVVNANVIEVFVLASGAMMIVFDRTVIVDMAAPPTTWSVNGGTSIQPGGFNYGTCCYLIYNGSAGPGDPVVIAANDPAARTPEGGYVNGAALAVSDM
jgi:hypothetical protein